MGKSLAVIRVQKILRRILRQRGRQGMRKSRRFNGARLIEKINDDQQPSSPQANGINNTREVIMPPRFLQDDETTRVEPVSSSSDFLSSGFEHDYLGYSSETQQVSETEFSVSSTSDDFTSFLPQPKTPGRSPSLESIYSYSYIPSPMSPLSPEGPSWYEHEGSVNETDSTESSDAAYNSEFDSDIDALPLTPDICYNDDDDDGF